MNAVLAVIGVAGMFLLLIGPHEAGHFAIAKLCRVRVIEFSIGAGTRLWSATRGGTVYALRAFPILGYVRMGGMEAGDFDDPSGFHHKSAWQRLAILAAGPVANFLVAIVVITVVGLVQVNGNPGKPLVIMGEHSDGKPFAATVTPAQVCKDAACQYQLGVRIQPLFTAQEAVVGGVTFPYTAIQNIMAGLGQLISGQVPGGLLGPNGLTGPVGIADVAYQSVGLGLDRYFFFVALLSVALGFTNLLPFFALDGGRMVVVVIEALRRRPFDRTAELNFQRFGLVALLGLAAVITFLDIQRIATGQFPGLTP